MPLVAARGCLATLCGDALSHAQTLPLKRLYFLQEERVQRLPPMAGGCKCISYLQSERGRCTCMMVLNDSDAGTPSSTGRTAVGVRGLSRCHGPRGETWKPAVASEGAGSSVKDRWHRIAAGTQHLLLVLGDLGSPASLGISSLCERMTASSSRLSKGYILVTLIKGSLLGATWRKTLPIIINSYVNQNQYSRIVIST